MRRIRILLVFALVGLLLVGYFALQGIGLLGGTVRARVKPVPKGDQEVAWIHAATNGANWERFIEGVRCVQRRWPGLEFDDSNAYPDQTTAVPEVVLGLPGSPRIHVRWYKLTSEASNEYWVKALARRDPAPLALIGGGSSDRARDLAMALEARQEWHGTRPLLLLTTATADKVSLGGDDNPSVQLMDIYPDRTFRFCFENSQISEAIRDLLWRHPLLRPNGSPVPGLTALATGLGGDPWAAVAMLGAAVPPPPPDVRVLTWDDDPYSLDLSNCFHKVFGEVGTDAEPVQSYTVEHSIGGYNRPNRAEAESLRDMIDTLVIGSGQRHLLVLPAVEKPARRALRGLVVAEPMEARNFIALTGDSFSLNVVYRDRHFAWDVRSMPMPLVFFAHQNPVAWAEPGAAPGAGAATPFPNATDDELLYADLVQVLLEGAYATSPGSNREPTLVTNSDQLRERLGRREPAFFTPKGNRVEGNGEFVVCLRPHTNNARVLPQATLEVWTRQGEGPGQDRWRLVKSLPVSYGTEEAAGHGG